MPDQDIASRGNKDYNWDRFNPSWYKDHNYYKLREDDHQILEIIRSHFARETRRGLRGIDVGAGANLYPALAMLPFCEQITLFEYSAANRDWLRGQLKNLDGTWDAFWEVLEEEAPYAAISDSWGKRLERLDVVAGDIMELAPEQGYDLATMFFVAESISPDITEFDRAVKRFTAALRPGGRFAAAFIKESTGYRVDDTWFPAVSIDRDQVAQRFSHLGVTVDTREIDLINPFREGYGGMIVVTGIVD